MVSTACAAFLQILKRVFVENLHLDFLLNLKRISPSSILKCLFFWMVTNNNSIHLLSSYIILLNYFTEYLQNLGERNSWIFQVFDYCRDKNSFDFFQKKLPACKKEEVPYLLSILKLNVRSSIDLIKKSLL